MFRSENIDEERVVSRGASASQEKSEGDRVDLTDQRAERLFEKIDSEKGGATLVMITISTETTATRTDHAVISAAAVRTGLRPTRQCNGGILEIWIS